ncbi:MAG TPA: hypothetical protein VHV76_08340 [Mycobacteriales bacterium]|nr:hypothetical protein [Mycobacteriales bacterium]
MACGGSSGLSKSAIDSKANAICAAENSARDAIPQPSDLGDATRAAAYFDRIEPVVVAATTKLSALKAASSVQNDWGAFFTLRQQETTLLQTIRRKADAKDASGLVDLKSEPPLGTKVDEAATKVGATACAD